MEKVIAIGHKNPDTDSVISAILVSRFGKKIFGFNVESRVAGCLNNETKFILDSLKIDKPKKIQKIKKEKVIMVDTTEPSQIIDGLNEDNLIGIIDHHNLGGLKSSKAIFVRTECIGCTCSIIYKILEERGIKISKKDAMLMMSGIISDTLNLTSPTTTKDDKRILSELEEISGKDSKEFAGELFAAKSSLKGLSPIKIFECDYKEFEMGDKKVGIGVWETTNPETVEAKRSAIVKVMEKNKKDRKLDFVLFGVVDILQNNSYCYLLGEEEKLLVEDVFSVKSLDGVAFLKGVVSRKKQLVPPLVKHFTK